MKNELFNGIEDIEIIKVSEASLLGRLPQPAVPVQCRSCRVHHPALPWANAVQWKQDSI